MRVGTYIIRVTGIMEKYFVMNMAFFSVTVKCYAKYIKPAQPDQTINFIVGSPTMRIQIQEFEELPNCGKAIEYESMLDNG